MSLMSGVEKLFDPKGALALSVSEYQTRPGQVQMAKAVAETLEEGGVLVVEAGTGVGKTYAYLVPLLLSGKTALISTATKALQDQLYLRDIPALRDQLGVPVRAALLKGRGSYLCLHRLQSARHAPTLTDAMLGQLASIEQWALGTRRGDLAEVDGLDDTAPLIPLVTSTRDNCLGTKCPQIGQCHVYAARREAMAADVVVVNHHLFFADLNVRESGVAELLPTVRAIIFDEAHQLNDVGVQFLGQQWSTGQIQTLAQDLLRTGQELARGFADWEGHAHALGNAAQAIWQGLSGRGLQGRLDGELLATVLAAPAAHQALANLQHAVLEAQHAMDSVAEIAPELGLLGTRSAELVEKLAQLQLPVPQGQVRWAEVSGQGNAGQLRVVQAPLDISQALRGRVLLGQGRPEAAVDNHDDAESGRAWIFTSATLGHDTELSWFVRSCGLEGAQVLQVPSPFEYPRQAGVYVPSTFATAGDDTHSAAVARLAWDGALQLNGRTMVLTTTLRALRHIGQVLAQIAIEHGRALEILVQGQAPKRELLERFCRPRAVDAPGCILVASASFWEGIDIPGDALQLLVIDKLPFAPPDDPLLRARAQQMEAEGKSAFKELHLPLAAVALKQGAGRLIRRESDRGVLVICDTRLTRMGYGRKLMSAIPPMKRLTDEAEYQQALQALTLKNGAC